MRMKPVFDKAAEFQGTDNEYNELVWTAAETGAIDADEFRLFAAQQVSHTDVLKAYKFLRQPGME